MITKVRIVVPMKPLDESKSRLRDSLPDERRLLLSLSMLVHVVGVATSVPDSSTTVFGGDRTVEDVCRRIGCTCSPDPGAGLNECLRAAFEEARSSATPDAGRTAEVDAVSAVVFLPADLPFVTPSDIAALAGALSPDRPVAIAPDRRNAGTNAIALLGAARLEPSMGPGSFLRHLAQLAVSPTRTGYQIVRRPGLAFDVDTPDDLRLLLTDRPDWWEQASRLVAGPETIQAPQGMRAT